MKILVDSTNCENNDGKLYLSIYNINAAWIEMLGTIGNVKSVWVDKLWDEERGPLLDIVVDTRAMDIKVGLSMTEYYKDPVSGIIHEDDLESAKMMQVISDIMVATGCYGMHYIYS